MSAKYLFSGRLAKSLHRFCRDRRGVTAVEFAVLTPFLALLVTGATDAGMAIRAQGHVNKAVLEGALFAHGQGAYNQNDITNAVKSAVSEPLNVTIQGYCGSVSGGLSATANLSCGTSDVSGLSGGYVQITAKLDHTPIFGAPWSTFLTNGMVTLSKTMTIRVN